MKGYIGILRGERPPHHGFSLPQQGAVFQQQRKFSFTFSLNRFLSTSADTNFLQCADCTRGEQCGSHLEGGRVERGQVWKRVCGCLAEEERGRKGGG